MKQENIPGTEVVDLTKPESPYVLSDIQVAAYEAAQKELEDAKKEIEGKKYYSDLSAADAIVLQNFLLNDATWKFTESLGIREVNREITESLKKKGKLFMGATAFEAMYFYLSRVEGAGEKVNSSAIPDLETYLRLLKGINAVRSSMSEDNKRIQHLEYVAASRGEGLEPADEVAETA
jgi:hypothetical protein